MSNDDMPVTVLTKITDALELHNKTLADHRKFIELLVQENAQLKKRLEKLESADSDSFDSSDVEFLSGIVARLVAIQVISNEQLSSEG